MIAVLPDSSSPAKRLVFRRIAIIAVSKSPMRRHKASSELFGLEAIAHACQPAPLHTRAQHTQNGDLSRPRASKSACLSHPLNFSLVLFQEHRRHLREYRHGRALRNKCRHRSACMEHPAR